MSWGQVTSTACRNGENSSAWENKAIAEQFETWRMGCTTTGQSRQQKSKGGWACKITLLISSPLLILKNQHDSQILTTVYTRFCFIEISCTGVKVQSDYYLDCNILQDLGKILGYRGRQIQNWTIQNWTWIRIPLPWKHNGKLWISRVIDMLVLSLESCLG